MLEEKIPSYLTWVNIITIHPVLKTGYMAVAILFYITFAAILCVKVF